MKTYWLTVLILLGAPMALVCGALADAGQPPLIPVDQIPVPGNSNNAVPPAPVAANPPGAAQAAPAAGKIAILPFDALGDVQGRDWVGRAVQQNLSAEVARIGGWFPISAAPLNGMIDTSSAVQAAQTVGADYVVFGSAEFAGNQVQIVGEVLSIKSDKALTGLKVTGAMSDLFSLEDQLGEQLASALRPSAVASGPATQPTTNDQQPVFAGQLPQFNYDYQDYSDAVPPLNYVDDWADEGGFPLVYYYGGGQMWHHHHHDSGTSPGNTTTPQPGHGFGPGRVIVANPQPIVASPVPGPGPIFPLNTGPAFAPGMVRSAPMMPAPTPGPGGIQAGAR